MSDACCASDLAAVERPPARLRDLREIQLSALAGIALMGGFATELSGTATALSMVFFGLAILAGGAAACQQADLPAVPPPQVS